MLAVQAPKWHYLEKALGTDLDAKQSHWTDRRIQIWVFDRYS